MRIKIDNFLHNITCRPGDRVKLYTVPKDYSDDGIYISQWAHGDIEPIPACLANESTLIADVSAATGQDGALTFSGYLAEGVEIDA